MLLEIQDPIELQVDAPSAGPGAKGGIEPGLAKRDFGPKLRRGPSQIEQHRTFHR